MIQYTRIHCITRFINYIERDFTACSKMKQRSRISCQNMQQIVYDSYRGTKQLKTGRNDRLGPTLIIFNLTYVDEIKITVRLGLARGFGVWCKIATSQTTKYRPKQ